MFPKGHHYRMIIFDKFPCQWIVFFCVCLILILVSTLMLLKYEEVNKRHLTRNFNVARFCCQNCLLNIGAKGRGIVAISDVLLERGLRFKTYLDKGEEGWNLNILGGGIIYGWPLIKNLSLQISNARFSNKNIFSYLFSIRHKLISIGFDVLIIDYFDVEIRQQIMRAKIWTRFAIFALIICRPIS